MSDPVEDHLRALDRALRGPRRTKAELLEEVAGHLEDAAEAYVARGHDPDRARARAVADFGSVEEVAPGFQATLAVAASRRTAWTLLAVTAPQAFVWDSGLDLGARAGGVDPRTTLFAALDAAVELAGAAALAGMVLAILATGIGNRWLRAGRLFARGTGLFALVVAVTMPAIGFTMITLSVGVDPGMYALAAALLGGPMLMAAHSARRCLAAA